MVAVLRVTAGVTAGLEQCISRADVSLWYSLFIHECDFRKSCGCPVPVLELVSPALPTIGNLPDTL